MVQFCGDNSVYFLIFSLSVLAPKVPSLFFFYWAFPQTIHVSCGLPQSLPDCYAFMAGLLESSFGSVADFLFWIPLKDDNFYFVFTFIVYGPVTIPGCQNVISRSPSGQSDIELPSLWQKMHHVIVHFYFWKRRPLYH